MQDENQTEAAQDETLVADAAAAIEDAADLGDELGGALGGDGLDGVTAAQGGVVLAVGHVLAEPAGLEHDRRPGDGVVAELPQRRGRGGATALLRFWCAKEALSKALGTGLRYGTGDICARSIDMATGVVGMEATRLWLQPFPELRGRIMEVRTFVMDDAVVAICVLPSDFVV